MGVGCGCCSNNQPKFAIDTQAFLKNPDWSEAVTTGKSGGIRMLHAENPDLINEPVDKYGHNAIHIAVKNKDGELLHYLLNNGANINARGGEDRNTALHEAVILKDMKTVRQLFAYGSDDSIVNKRNQRAIDLCPKVLKREFTKAKTYRNKHRDKLQKLGKHYQQTSDIKIAGMSLETTSTGQINHYLKTQDYELNFYRNKQKEIEERDMALTAFGDDVGCEVDEIAMTLQKVPDTGRLWQKWAKKQQLTRQTEIYKIFYGLTVLTLKKKNPRSKKPPAQRIKMLTTRICQNLPKKKGKVTLTKEDFEKKCHSILYKLHDEMVNEEMDTKPSDT